MALTAYITATPLDSGKFKDIYSSIKEFKSRFKERFELDHYMGGVVDDTDPTCEGYHKQLTMNGGEYNATNIPTTIPACPTGGIVFFSIGGELCCYDGNTAKQITDGGVMSFLTLEDFESSHTIESMASDGSGTFCVLTKTFDQYSIPTFSIYKTTNFSTFTLVKTKVYALPGLGVNYACKANSAIKYENGTFVFCIYEVVLSGSNHSNRILCISSSDGSSFTETAVFGSLPNAPYWDNYINVSYGDGKYIFIVGSTEVYTATAIGDLTAAYVTQIITGQYCVSIEYGLSMFMVVASNRKIYTSSDASTWAEAEDLSSTTTAYNSDLKLHNGVFTLSFITSYDGGDYGYRRVMLYTNDGATFYTFFTYYGSCSLFYNGGVFVAKNVDFGGNHLMHIWNGVFDYSAGGDVTGIITNDANDNLVPDYNYIVYGDEYYSFIGSIIYRWHKFLELE